MRILLLGCVFLASGLARADLIIPAQQACREKKVGDTCDVGSTCQSLGFSCQAGICRQHDAEDACRAAGCRWEEGLTCQAAATTPTSATPTSTSAPTTSTAPPMTPSSCAQSNLAGAFPGLLAALLLARRSRSVRGKAVGHPIKA